MRIFVGAAEDRKVHGRSTVEERGLISIPERFADRCDVAERHAHAFGCRHHANVAERLRGLALLHHPQGHVAAGAVDAAGAGLDGG